MFDANNLPQRIAKQVNGLVWYCDTIGRSGSAIWLYDNMVLKIEKASSSSANEKQLLEWLDGKLPVPKIIEYETRDGYSFLLMTKLSGEMACLCENMHCLDRTVRALAEGLQQLWQINISDCPLANVVSEKLKEAQDKMQNHLVHTTDFDPETFGAEGFQDLSHLYNYLAQNSPTQDLVLSHGDFCLPNVFVSGCKATGFVDWGTGGIADRWQDIALCLRSLQFNYVECGLYGETDCQRYEQLLFSELGMEPCEEKTRYYGLLEKLF